MLSESTFRNCGPEKVIPDDRLTQGLLVRRFTSGQLHPENL